jgi:hypothetical protein
MNQACVFKLFELGENKDTIAAGTCLDEKTVRFHRDGDQASLKSLALYKDYIKKVRRRRIKA